MNASHDMIACSLMNGRSNKCTCDASDDGLITEDEIFEIAKRTSSALELHQELIDFARAIEQHARRMIVDTSLGPIA